jgi:hypothetical protein
MKVGNENMKISAKRALAGAVALSVSFALAQPALAEVGVTVNGDGVDFNPPPIVQAGRVFVPLRGVFERLGASVVYDNGTINATGSGRDISLHIGSTQASVNGQDQIIDVAPFIVGASTYVPLRFISEALGASVNYDDSDQQVAITTAGAPQSYQAPATDTFDTDGTYASYAPPPIPSYAQPYDEVPNDVWQPGYWAWGPYGYYWVPGTWVAAPQPGYLWTPGYWNGANPTSYVWHPGFWAIVVGFYGGVNYGGGYFGHGYNGGRWNHNTFVYNTYVTHVNTTIVRNVYVDRSVVVNNYGTRVSYNGGPSGVHAAPTAQEEAAARAKHLGVTPAQRQHVLVAEQDRRLLATVNHDTPPVTAVARPLSVSNRPEGFEAVKPVPHAVVHPVPVAAPATVHEPARVTQHAAVAPHVARPVHTVAAYRPVTPAYRPPARDYHAPVPAYRPATPTYEAPAVHARAIVQPARVIPPPPHVNAYRAQAPARPAEAPRAAHDEKR